MAFGAVYGPPFVREGEVRRDATMNDLPQLHQAGAGFESSTSAGGVICEPTTPPLDSRHLDMLYRAMT
jgi:trimethylamine--corrinoid protein Co-methyltransferase